MRKYSLAVDVWTESPTVDQNTDVVILEKAAMVEIENRMIRMAAMLLQAGATIALSQPERFGFTAMKIEQFHVLNEPYGYQTYGLRGEGQMPVLRHNMSAETALRNAVELATGSSIVDWCLFAELGEE